MKKRWALESEVLGLSSIMITAWLCGFGQDALSPLSLIFHICKLGTANVKGNMLLSSLNCIEDRMRCKKGSCEL